MLVVLGMLLKSIFIFFADMSSIVMQELIEDLKATKGSNCSGIG